MLRGALGLVSLLVVGVLAAYYFTATQPEVSQPGQYQAIEAQANAAAAKMAKDPQTRLDEASGEAPATATNAPAPGN